MCTHRTLHSHSAHASTHPLKERARPSGATHDAASSGRPRSYCLVVASGTETGDGGPVSDVSIRRAIVRYMRAERYSARPLAEVGDASSATWPDRALHEEETRRRRRLSKRRTAATHCEMAQNKRTRRMPPCSLNNGGGAGSSRHGGRGHLRVDGWGLEASRLRCNSLSQVVAASDERGTQRAGTITLCRLSVCPSFSAFSLLSSRPSLLRSVSVSLGRRHSGLVLNLKWVRWLRARWVSREVRSSPRFQTAQYCARTPGRSEAPAVCPH